MIRHYLTTLALRWENASWQSALITAAILMLVGVIAIIIAEETQK